MAPNKDSKVQFVQNQACLVPLVIWVVTNLLQKLQKVEILTLFKGGVKLRTPSLKHITLFCENEACLAPQPCKTAKVLNLDISIFQFCQKALFDHVFLIKCIFYDM